MVVIIGAGPIGLAVAVELKRKGIEAKIIEQGCLVNSIFHYPQNMTFFSTSERLEIGEVPFISHNPKPTRQEALEYYRRVAEHYALDINLYEEVTALTGQDGDFTIQAARDEYNADKVVVATGFYNIPRRMDIPGEELEKVRHYYGQAHGYAWQNVAVVGGGNSAVDAALETYRSNANVTLVVRGDTLKDSIKYWVKPDIENRIKNDEIKAYFNSTITEINSKSIIIDSPEGKKEIVNDFVLAMTGYQPNFKMMKKFGIHLTDDKNKMPVFDDGTLETNKAGVYVAGVVCGGMDTSSLFIENTRIHARHIAEDVQS